MEVVKNFAVLRGNVEVKDGVITHTILTSNDEKVSEDAEKSEIRSDVEFSNGIVEFKANRRMKNVVVIGFKFIE